MHFDLAEQIDLYIAQNDGSVQAIREGNKYGFVFIKAPVQRWTMV